MIYKRTTRGSEELALRVFGMPPALRPYLMRINGKTSVEALQGRHPDLVGFDDSLKTLAELGFVELVSSSAPSPVIAAPQVPPASISTREADSKPSVKPAAVVSVPVKPLPAVPLPKAPPAATPTPAPIAPAVPLPKAPPVATPTPALIAPAVPLPVAAEVPRPAREIKKEAIPQKLSAPPVRVPAMPTIQRTVETVVAPLKPALVQAEPADALPSTGVTEVPPSSQAESIQDLQLMKASMKKDCQDLMGQDAEHLIQRINNCISMGSLLLTMVSIKKIIALYAGDPAAEKFEDRYRQLAKVQAGGSVTVFR